MNVNLSMIQHHRADLDGLRMHFVEAGKGPAVVLLHGFPETWYAWRYQIAPLAKTLSSYRAGSARLWCH